MLATIGLALGGSAGCTDVLDGGSDGRSVEVPDRTRIGDPLECSISGGSAGATVPLEVTVSAGADRTYRASTSVSLADDGTARIPIEALADRSVPGMALWPLRSDDPAAPVFFTTDRSVTCSVSLGDDWPDVETTRVLVADGVERTEVSDPVHGRLYTAGSESGPGVVVLHGSAGALGPLDRLCRMLCTRGHTVLALQYFDGSVPDLPDTLQRVPIEYFERAIDWLRERPSVDDTVGLLGISRGGEAVLLAGATLEHDGPVISYVGSGVVTPGWPDVDAPAWTYDGEPVGDPSAYAALRERYGDDEQLFAELDPDELPHLEPPLAIPVERIDGPVCLFSGTDDPLWPSAPLSAVAKRRLERFDHDHRFEHHVFEDAGHSFLTPYARGPNRGGGTTLGNRYASAAAFATSVSFLES